MNRTLCARHRVNWIEVESKTKNNKRSHISGRIVTWIMININRNLISREKLNDRLGKTTDCAVFLIYYNYFGIRPKIRTSTF